MDRDIPSFNRTVMQRIYQKNHQLHLKRLQNIKSGISSTKCHNKESHLTNSTSLIGSNYHSRLPQYHNPKRQSLQEMNNSKIQRENALLFKKMIKIMKRPDKNNDPTAPRYHVRMNAAKQRMSMQFNKINEQNRTLFHRLEQQKPTIDMKKLSDQRLKNLNILKFLGKYPNQQAISRVKQHQLNSFDTRGKKTTYTSNRIYYNNINLTHHHNQSDGHDEEYQIDEQNDGHYEYERFRNDIQLYDQEINQLKDQTRKATTSNTRTIDKFTATTTTNYYNPRHNSYQEQFAHKSIRLTNDKNHPKSTTDEPLPPSRRKFLSQGGNRHAMYNRDQGQKFYHQIKQNTYQEDIHTNHDQPSTHDQFSTHDQPSASYPYYLNHPSNNIVIQDRLNNYYNMNNKRKTLQNITEMKPIMRKPINRDSIQSNIPKPYPIATNPQRKLNTKNSKTNLGTGVEPLPEEIEPSLKPQFAVFENEFYHQSMREQDEQYETEPSPKRGAQKHMNQAHNHNSKGSQNVMEIQQHNKQNLPSHRQTSKYSHSEDKPNHSENTSNQHHLASNQHNFPLKKPNFPSNQHHLASDINQPKPDRSENITRPQLNQSNMILLYKASVNMIELLTRQEIEELAKDIQVMSSNNTSEMLPQLNGILFGLNMILTDYSASISIFRLSDSYRVSISSITLNQHQNSKKNKQLYSHQQQPSQNSHLSPQFPQPQPDPSITQLIHSYIQIYFTHIIEVDIPEQQGSLLVQQIDYNYKFFITQMVKIQKDTTSDQSHQIQHNTFFYRLVIDIKDQDQQNHQLQKEQQTNLLNHFNDETKQFHQQPNSSTTHQQPSKHQNHPQTNPFNHAKDQTLEPILKKPQLISSNIPQQNNSLPQNHHEKSIYVEALDQQLL